MLENKKVIIFDLDGTLIDSIGIWSEIDKKLIEIIGGNETDIAQISKQRDETLKKYSKCEDAYLEYCGFLGEKYHSNLPKAEIKRRRYEIAQDYLRNVIEYKEGAPEFLKYLKDKGFTLVIASTTNDHTIEAYRHENKNIMSMANFDDIFTFILAKGSVKELKPNPEIHYKVMEKLNVSPDECIIFEDTLIGVEAANAAKIDVVAMYDKYSDCNREEINKLSKYQFKNFKEALKLIKEELQN